MRFVALSLALTLVSASAAAAEAAPEMTARPAMMAAKADQARLIDITTAGEQLVAVGEEGVILRSNDGKTWQQVPSPVNVMLTRVRFVDAQHGWILGYDATILQTVDGGANWTLRHYDATSYALYDLLFIDTQHGLAVGGYGRMFETLDGGKTWNPQTSALTQVGLHLNTLLQMADGSLIVVGERGLIARSKDAGMSWQILSSPYIGSFFGARLQGDKGLLVYGMRGNMFVTENIEACATIDIAKWDPDTRKTVTQAALIAKLGWRQIDNDIQESLFGVVPLKDSSLLFLGVNGTVVRLPANKFVLEPIKTPAVETLVHAVDYKGHVIAVGRRGIQDIGVQP